MAAFSVTARPKCPGVSAPGGFKVYALMPACAYNWCTSYMASKEPAGMDQTANGIAAGTRLGPYEIEAPLGAGGMGQVFRARDTRLGRAVAIKIVHERFSERFQ